MFVARLVVMLRMLVAGVALTECIWTLVDLTRLRTIKNQNGKRHCVYGTTFEFPDFPAILAIPEAVVGVLSANLAFNAACCAFSQRFPPFGPEPEVVVINLDFVRSVMGRIVVIVVGFAVAVATQLFATNVGALVQANVGNP